MEKIHSHLEPNEGRNEPDCLEARQVCVFLPDFQHPLQIVVLFEGLGDSAQNGLGQLRVGPAGSSQQVNADDRVLLIMRGFEGFVFFGLKAGPSSIVVGQLSLSLKRLSLIYSKLKFKNF
jgi:hypothetical protein